MVSVSTCVESRSPGVVSRQPKFAIGFQLRRKSFASVNVEGEDVALGREFVDGFDLGVILSDVVNFYTRYLSFESACGIRVCGISSDDGVVQTSGVYRTAGSDASHAYSINVSSQRRRSPLDTHHRPLVRRYRSEIVDVVLGSSIEYGSVYRRAVFTEDELRC